ncbi:MAG: O-antigen ligase family protein [Armatimonadetes bacterium]|nr:O-antigen ligase family protein [Armatimonadota bacterium]
MRLERIRDATLLLTVAGYSAGFGAPAGLLVVFAAEAVAGSWRWVPTRLDRPLLALTVVLLVSAVVSEWRTLALLNTALFGLTALAGIRGVAAYHRGEVSRSLRAVHVWIAGGVAAAAWGLARFWFSGIEASTGPLSSNALGTTLAVAAVLALGLLIDDDGRYRWPLAAAGGILMTGLAATFARAAWLGAVAGMATLMLLATGRRARIAMLMAAAAAVALAVAVWPRWPAFSAEIRSLGSLQANRNRLILWKIVPRMVADDPVVGVGFGAFSRAYQRYRPPDPLDADPPFAHNIILNFAAETGLVGVAALIALCGAGLAALWRRVARSPPGSPAHTLASAVLAAAVALLVNQMFDGTVLSVNLGFGLFALLAMGAADRSRAPAA